ncbi:MAG: hypothetical protein IKW63_05340 [Elusimicrobiaceae bacterium]|nr:hypothetical protein [Elusimicrobiaceae bacterium]
MKNHIAFLFLFFFSALSLSAAQWGVLDDFVQAPQEQREADYAMDKFLSGQKVYYYIHHPTTGDLQSDIKYNQLIVESIKIWPAFVRQNIINSGREQEFSDIMPLLIRGIFLQKTNSEEYADIKVLFKQQSEVYSVCGKDAAGCFSEYEKRITLPILSENSAKESEVVNILTHEVGHFYGLADQYKNGAGNSSLTHATSDRIDSNFSIMAQGDYLGCDDVDGFINTIDLALAKRNGSYSARAQKGWKSFCDDTMYKNAKVLNKKDYGVGNTTYKYDSEGNIAKVESFNPYLVAEETNYTQGFPYINHEKNLRIFFVLFKNVSPYPVFQASIYPNSGGGNIRTIYAERVAHEDYGFPIERFSDIFWRVPHNKGNVLIEFSKEQQCQATDTNAHDFLFDQDGNLLKQKFSYFQFADSIEKPPLNTLLTKLPVDVFMVGQRSPDSEISSSCNFSINGEDDSLVFKKLQLVSSKEDILEQISRQYNVSTQDIIESAYQMCKSSYPIDTREADAFRKYCSLFSKIEKASF